ncbi:hypothetical protein HNR60_003671 [Rhodopseudomonas rhenobacensis]|uniref:Tlde1 domain-containing protein n=1 Tax=Rhodopseudomonas rhenobacensis TaxID=87461 RepID=A0A7W7Z6V7_9BRAD|nr:DUF2778 domain-containing protein [Rhodopseudomonas rhenobacensis]MBB5048900.1 hypothetical protein [Rhodopseudomonas rhenobacensis]
MRNNSSALKKAAARGRAPRKAGPFNVVGGVAVAVAVAACGWTVHVNVFSASIYPSIAASHEPIVAAPRLAAAKPAAPVAAVTTPTEPDVTVAMLTSAPGLSPEQFAERFAPPLDAVAPAPVIEAAPAKPQIAAAPVAAVPLPPVRQAALQPAPKAAAQAAPQPAAQVAEAAPLPPQRPAETKTTPAKGPSLREVAQASRAASLAAAAQTKPASIFEKLFGKSEPAGSVLAFAGSDGGVGSDGRDTVSSARYDRSTAVYDIKARVVYMPDGTKLEAHSGLGSRLDDPRYVHERMRGATPPHLYDLTMRESLFHGVAALRLNPVGGEGAIHGRNGLLAHTYMLGPNGDSNGCVSFRNYDAFLRAFRNGQVKRLAVVASLDS